MKALFVGLGSIGQRHIRNLTELCAEGGTVPEITALRRSTRPLPDDVYRMVQQEVAELPAGEQYDVAFITSPTHRHAQDIAALKGRVGAFFIEKPLFHKTGIDLDEVGLSAGQKAYVAAPMRWCSLYTALRLHLNPVAPYSVRALCSSYLPDWRPDTDYREVYSAHRDMGGGVALDLIHEWDYLVDLFGMPAASLAVRQQVSKLELDSDDIALYIAQYDGFLCEVHLDYFGREPRRSLEVFTQDGTITADFIENTLTLPSGLVERYPEDANRRYRREMRYFLHYALGEEPPQNLNSPRRALEVLKLALGEYPWQNG